MMIVAAYGVTVLLAILPPHGQEGPRPIPDAVTEELLRAHPFREPKGCVLEPWQRKSFSEELRHSISEVR